MRAFIQKSIIIASRLESPLLARLSPVRMTQSSKSCPVWAPSMTRRLIRMRSLPALVWLASRPMTSTW